MDTDLWLAAAAVIRQR